MLWWLLILAEFVAFDMLYFVKVQNITKFENGSEKSKHLVN